jgi:hypothetical protein
MLLFGILGGCSFVTLNIYLENKNNLINLLFKISYNLLYFYGNVEIFVKNIYNKISENETVVSIKKKVKDYYNELYNYNIEIVNSNIVEKINFKNIVGNIVENLNLFKNNDLIIYSIPSNIQDSSSQLNKIIIYDSQDFFKGIKICDFKFISLSLDIKTEINNDVDNDIDNDKYNYEIKLSNKNENYFVVNNRINVVLLSYLLKVQHNIDINPLIFEYSVRIIDQNANIFTINEKEEIILYESNYEVITYIYKFKKD